jgi:hypothetical protein
MVARTARIVGSENAALRSVARGGVDSSRRRILHRHQSRDVLEALHRLLVPRDRDARGGERR